MITPIIEKLHKDRYISRKQKIYLLGPTPPRPRQFYLLPKIHKDPASWTIPHQIPPGRPIVSDCGSETYRVAEFIDSFINPLSQRHDSYVKDTYEFIQKIKSVTVPNTAFLFSMDVDSLYTNIDTSLGLKAVEEIFRRFPDDQRPDEALLSLLKINLERNDFEFGPSCFLQIHGTAMGKKFAPAYANIYMADWERTVLEKCPKLPTLYIRYLDDIFGVWEHSEEEFTQFVKILNNHHSTINLKATLKSDKIEFLDTEVFFAYKDDGTKNLNTKVFFKTTDTHALLHKKSFHPRHTFRGIIKSQLIRFHRICTDPKDVAEATSVLFKALRHRGYSRSFLRTIKLEVQTKYTNAMVPRKITQNEGPRLIPLVLTFSSSSRILGRQTRENFTKLQEESEEFRECKMITAYKRNRNLKDLLVHASLKNEKTQKDPCHKKSSFIFNIHSKLGAPVTQKVSLDAPNAIYLLECDKCKKLYVGQTKNPIKKRLYQHLYCISKTDKSYLLYSHFREHGVTNLRYMGLEANPTWTLTQRLAREAHWIRTVNTIHPYGLNEQLDTRNQYVP